MQTNTHFEYYPASPFQKAEFMKHLYAKQKIQPFNCTISTNLKIVDVNILKKVFDTIIERYKIFRTSLIMKNGEILQQVWPFHSSILDIDFIDISTVNQQVEMLNSIVFQKRYRIFFPDQYPWLDVCIIKKGEKDYILFICIPHMVMDAASIGILKKELNVLYKAYIKDEKIVLPVTFQFCDYIQTVYEELRSNKGVQHRVFLSKLLQDIPKNNLTTKFSITEDNRIYSYKESLLNELKQAYGNISKKAQKRFWGNVSYIYRKPGAPFIFFMDEARFVILKEVSASTNMSMSTILQAIFCLLVFKLTGEEEILLGICTDLRDTDRLNEIIGFMINTVFSRHRIHKEKYISDFFKDVFSTTLQSYRHKICPFDMILYESDISLEYAGSLFLNIMTLNSTISEKKYEQVPEQYEEKKYNTYFNIDCIIHIYNNGIHFNCSYNPELFSRPTIEFFFSQYMLILDNFNNLSEMKVRDIL